MAAEASIYEQLLLVVGLRELEEQDLGREIVDVGHTEGDDALLKLMGNDLDPGSVQAGRRHEAEQKNTP